MSINITLTEEQITDVLDKDTDLKYQIFRDSAGPDTITEDSIFPERLKFYMDKKGSNSSDVVAFFKANYPFLAKSTSTIQHYLNGVRTPGLSTVFALADFLDIAPAQLLPAKPGKYIEYKGDHVEMIEPIKADPSPSDPIDHNVVIEEEDYMEGDPLIRESSDSTISEDIPTPVETNSYIENNNVVFQDSLDETPEEAIEDNQDIADSDTTESIEKESEEVEIAPEVEDSTSIEDDDFDLDDLSDKQDQADQFLKDLFSDSSTTPYDEYTKENDE
tara:strand:- start:8996 stop:9820 length:825 start_codon:yes stop_codon:yes gene_type:complete